MKHLKLILLFCLCFPLVGNAQYGGTFTSSITVNNLTIGTQYTQTYLIASFGTPMYSSMSEFGLDEGYLYGNSFFRFAENGMFVGFVVRDNTFLVLEQYNGGIRIGDLISKVSLLGGIGWRLEAKPNGMYELWMNDEVMYFKVESGRITFISYDTSL